MIRKLFESANGEVWIDVTQPTATELGELAHQYQLHATSVRDCLDPSHLPKLERFGDQSFVILRYGDQASYPDWEADTVQELTRKLAIFSGKRFLITVHRTDAPFLDHIANHLKANQLPSTSGSIVSQVLLAIFYEVFSSYAQPLAWADGNFETTELAMLKERPTQAVLQKVYFLKRKVVVLKRMLRQLTTTLESAQPLLPAGPYLEDVRDRAARQLFDASELEDDVVHLVSVYLSLASHRTNEVMRVLTLFSVFFLPLTFVVGVYGMNFDYLPELHWRYGYPATWALMGVTTTAIYIWFRRKSWL